MVLVAEEAVSAAEVVAAVVAAAPDAGRKYLVNRSIARSAAK